MHAAFGTFVSSERATGVACTPVGKLITYNADRERVPSKGVDSGGLAIRHTIAQGEFLRCGEGGTQWTFRSGISR